MSQQCVHRQRGAQKRSAAKNYHFRQTHHMKCCGLLPKEASLTPRSRDVVSFAPPSSFMLAFPVAGVELHSRKTDRCRQELQCLSDDSLEPHDQLHCSAYVNPYIHVDCLVIQGDSVDRQCVCHINRSALSMSILDLTSSSRGAPRSRSRSIWPV